MDVEQDNRFHLSYPSDRDSEPRHCPMNQLEKLLFPHLQPWQRKRNLKTILFVLAISIIFAAIIGAMMYFRNSRQF